MERGTEEERREGQPAAEHYKRFKNVINEVLDYA